MIQLLFTGTEQEFEEYKKLVLNEIPESRISLIQVTPHGYMFSMVIDALSCFVAGKIMGIYLSQKVIKDTFL